MDGKENEANKEAYMKAFLAIISHTELSIW